MYRVAAPQRALIAIATTAFLAGCSSTSAGELHGSPDASVDSAIADAQAEEDSPSAQHEASVPETCNFIDDNGDGRVDEGFAWTAGEWKHLLSTKRFALVAPPVALDDDRIAVAGWDQFGDPGDRAFAGIWKSDGTRVAGPVWIDVPKSYSDAGVGGMDIPSLSRLGQDRLLLLFGSTDWDGCKSGCPAVATQLSSNELGVIESVPLSLPQLRGDEQKSVLCPSATQCLLLARAGALGNTPTLFSYDPSSQTVAWSHEFQGVSAANFELDDGKIWLMVQMPDADGGADSQVLHVLGLDGKAVQPPKVVGAVPAGVVSPIRHRNGSTYSDIASGESGQRALVRIPDDGSPAVFGAATTDATFAVEVLGDTVVHVQMDGAFGLRLSRLSRNLAPLNVPKQSFVIPGGYLKGAAALVRVGSRISLVQANYDGRSVDMTTLECEP